MKMKNIVPKKILVLLFIILSISIFFPGVTAAASPDFALFDDYNRAELGVTGDGGAYNSPNSAGTEIYWIQKANAEALIENGALKLTMHKNGWFGEGVAFKDPQYKYIVMKVKGEKGGEEKLLSLNPDAKGLRNFTDLKRPDGNPLAPITKDYQNIVIDIDKSGFNLPSGFEAIHFNNTGELTIYIDEIYLSRTGIPADLIKVSASADESEAAAASDPDSGITADATNANTLIDSNASANNSSEKSLSGAASTKNRKPVLISIIVAIMAILIAGVVYNSFIRTPASKK